MKHYAGLDISVKETSICIVDETGAICREIKVTSHPEDLVQALTIPRGGSFGSGSKPALCRNGCTADWLRRACRRSA